VWLRGGDDLKEGEVALCGLEGDDLKGGEVALCGLRGR